MDAIKIGQIIRAHRKTSGLSREEFARLAGVGKTVVYDIEHGKETVQLNTLLKELHVLNISIELKSPLMQRLGYADSDHYRKDAAIAFCGAGTMGSPCRHIFFDFPGKIGLSENSSGSFQTPGVSLISENPARNSGCTASGSGR